MTNNNDNKLSKVIYLKSQKVHYLSENNKTLCDINVSDTANDNKLWVDSDLEVDCLTCIKKVGNYLEYIPFEKGTIIELSSGEKVKVFLDDKRKYKNIIIVEFEKKLRVIDRATKSMAYTNQIK